MRPGVASTSELTATTSPESRREHVARRLDAFNHGCGIALLQRLADRRRFGKDDVAELLLRVLADADDALRAFDPEILMVLGVADLDISAPLFSRDNRRGDKTAARRRARSTACRAQSRADRRSDHRVCARDEAHRDRTADAGAEPA